MNEPVFARSEYENRLSSVRATMNRRGVDALLVLDPRNVNYLAGVDSQGISHLQCLVVTDEEPTLVTWDLEAPGVELTSWLSRIVTYSWLEDPAERVADAIAGLGLDSKRLAIELRARELSAATFAAIRERLPEASFLDAFGIVESARLRKSPAEVAYMKEAAALTDEAVRVALNVITPGARDSEVAAAIVDALYRGGSETISWGPIVTAGPGAGVPHTTFKGRTLALGDTVFLELSGQRNRYVAPVMRTIYLGNPPPDVIAFRDAGLAALDAVLENAAAHVPSGQVARLAMEQLQPVMDKAYFHGLFGYSVGIGFPPGWYETLGFDIRSDNDRDLEEGMVFHVPVSLRRPGQFGVNQSQTVLITETGVDPLTTTSAAMVIRP